MARIARKQQRIAIIYKDTKNNSDLQILVLLYSFSSYYYTISMSDLSEISISFLTSRTMLMIGNGIIRYDDFPRHPRGLISIFSDMYLHTQFLHTCFKISKSRYNDFIHKTVNILFVWERNNLVETFPPHTPVPSLTSVRELVIVEHHVHLDSAPQAIAQQ